MKRAYLAVLCLALAIPAAAADPRIEQALQKASEQVRKGKPDDAVKTMQKAAAQAGTVEAQLALASIQGRVGQPEAAAESIKRAAEAAASPADKAMAFAALSALHLAEGTGKEALAQAERAVAAQETPVSLAALGRAQARLEQVASALATLDKALQAGAAHAAVHEAHGDGLLAAGRAAEAAAAYRKAMAAEPARTSARAGLARALSIQGQHAEAVREARAAAEHDAASSEAQSALAEALFAQDPKQWNDAIGAAQEAVRLGPRNLAAHLAVAHIFAAGGNLPHADASYRTALGLDPDSVPALLGLVHIQATQGKYEEALTAARTLVNARPDSASANVTFGTMLARRGQWKDAVMALQKATAGGAATADTWALLGTALYEERRMAEAAEAYARAVQLDPAHTGHRVTHGLLLGVAGQKEAGVAALRKVVEDPAYKEADAWINLGWLYRNLDPKRPADAATAYQNALKVEPTNGQALLGLGWAQYYSRSYDAAIQTFQKTAETDDSLKGIAHNGEAWSHLFKKDATQADALRLKAEAAGRMDPKLTENIDRVRRGIEAQEKVADKSDDAPVRAVPTVTADTVIYALYRGTPNEKIKAAGHCKKFGTACLDGLIATLHADANPAVRIAVANAIAAMGPAGKKAAPYLSQVLALGNCEVVPSLECMERVEALAKMLKAVAVALRSVKGL